MKYFSYDEFDSPDDPGSGKKYMDKRFLDALDDARDVAGVPFKINSGFRTPEHNAKVGGSANSSHMKGCAADIHCPDNEMRFHIIDALYYVGFDRIGVGKTFIHVDLDMEKTPKRMWVY